MATVVKGPGSDKSISDKPLFEGKKYLLAIGIDKYDTSKGFQPLQYPVEDAGKLAKLLINEYDFKPENVITLFNEKCNKDDIIETIVKLKEKLDPNTDQLVVFFSGHGDVTGNIGYWLPYNAKETMALNLPVSTILDLLIGCCRQVLLIIDCCFSGITVDKAYPRSVFADLDAKSSTFLVVTAGNKYQQVPDKSVFMEELLEHLSSKNISNLNELAGYLKNALDSREETDVTAFSSNDQGGLPFVLQRSDRIAFELTNSFFALNYNDQTPRIVGKRLFNLVYLRGTKDCGHHLFSHRYFKQNGSTNISMFSYDPKVISFGRDSQSADYNIWNKIEGDFGLEKNAQPHRILDKIFAELKSKNWVLIVKIDNNCDNQTLESTLLDFWEKTNEYISNFPAEYKEPKNKIFFFIWDRRGDATEVIQDKWSEPLKADLAKIMHLPPIKPLKPNGDLLDWYNDIKTNNLLLKKDETFTCIDLNSILPPKTSDTIANVICKISDHCKRMEVYDRLFIKKNLWTQ